MDKLTTYRLPDDSPLSYFQEVMRCQELKYFASDHFPPSLMQDTYRMNKAVMEAMKVLEAVNIPVEEHFKDFYCISNTGSIIHEWRFSKMALSLVIFSCETREPQLARMKYELLKSFMAKL